MEISQRYNLVPVKDNCTLFAPTPYFQAQAIQQSSFKFLPCRPLLPWQRIILGQKSTTTRPPWKNCSLFAPTPYFRAWAIRRCHLNFSPTDPCCLGNEFLDKIDYNSAPVKDNCSLFALTPLFSGPGYAVVSCKVLPWRPLLSWQPTVFIQRQNWLQVHKRVKRWNAAARPIYSVAMGQIPRSTERISSTWE